MEQQELINWLIGVVSTIMGFLLHTIWGAVKDLQTSDTEIKEDIGAIKVLVAGAYVTRDEFNNHMTAVYAKLDVIVDSVNKK